MNLSPDDWAFEKLADIYLARGDEAMWQATLDANLNHEDLFQAHYLVQQKLAEHFMAKKDWLKALPYAEAAASSGAGWAVECLVNCQTAPSTGTRPRKPPATPVASRAGYGGTPGVARPVTETSKKRAEVAGYYKGLEDRGDPKACIPVGFFKWGENDQAALAAYRKAMEGTKSPLAALLSAMMMDASIAMPSGTNC